MQIYINVGFGSDVTIAELAKAVGQAVGYEWAIIFDTSKTDATLRKWMDSRRLNHLGWSAKIGLDEGLRLAYEDMLLR